MTDRKNGGHGNASDSGNSGTGRAVDGDGGMSGQGKQPAEQPVRQPARAPEPARTDRNEGGKASTK